MFGKGLISMDKVTVKISDLVFCETNFEFTFNRKTYLYNRVIDMDSKTILAYFNATIIDCTFAGNAEILVDPKEYEENLTNALYAIFLNKPNMVVKSAGEICVVYGEYDGSGVIEIPVNLDLRPWQDEYKIELN